MSRTIGLEETLRAAFSNMIRGVWTAIPCKILRINNSLSDQSVDVVPLINQVAKNGQFKRRPVIYSVPLIFPASKSSAFTFPVNTNDVVLCVFSMRGLEAFKSSEGQERDPLDFSSYEGKDAIAIPGLFPFNMAINNPSKRTLPHSTQDAVVSHNIGTQNECEIRLLNDGGIKITTPGDIVVDAGGKADLTAASVDVHAGSVNLGDGGAPIARLGDDIEVVIPSGSSAGTYQGTIISGSDNNNSA